MYGLLWTLLKSWLTSESVKAGGKKAAKGAAKGAGIVGLVAATQMVTMQNVEQKISQEVAKQNIVNDGTKQMLAEIREDSKDIKANIRMITREMLRRHASRNEPVTTAILLESRNQKEN